jgi:YD repeat-containing protein
LGSTIVVLPRLHRHHHNYGYDANGNQTSHTIGGSTSTLTYDYENRLTAVSGATSASFVYDGAGSETGTQPRQSHLGRQVHTMQ